jgi:hypothetical protein
MKKISQLIVLLAVFLATHGQVIINPQMPALGLVLKSQLWNIGIINTSNLSLQSQVQMTMTDATNNQRVFSGTSKIITLPKGLTQISATDAAPVTYNVLSSGYGIDTSPDGFLPVGTFTVCYSVTVQNQEGPESVAEECENVEVSPISPPSLVLPTDSEGIEITRPLFTWLPPAPYNLFTNLTYSFALVELQPTQNGATAIQQNIPLQTQENLTVTSYQYPVSLPELDTGKLYAWQITANNGYSPVSKSEIWVFKVKKLNQDLSTHPAGDYYIRAKRTVDGGYGLCKGLLRYTYLSESSEDYINFNLYDISSSKRQSIQLDSSYMQVHFGQNYNELDFTGSNILTDKHIYLLELINSRSEHWYLKFEYIKPN